MSVAQDAYEAWAEAMPTRQPGFFELSSAERDAWEAVGAMFTPDEDAAVCMVCAQWLEPEASEPKTAEPASNETH
jgi:hypothetical protein